MSYNFDGVDDYIDFASPASVDNAEPFSFVAWIAPDSIGEAAAGRVIAKESSGSGTGVWFLSLRTGPATQLFFRRNYATTNLDVLSVSGTIRTDGTFQHIALTWDGSATATNVHLYINGAETTYAAQTNGAGAKNTDAALRLFLGNRGTQDRSFDGRMAGIHFARRVLSLNEIRTLMYHGGGVGSLIGSVTSTGGFLYHLPGQILLATTAVDYSGIDPEGVPVTGVTLDAQSPPGNELFTPSVPMGGGAC